MSCSYVEETWQRIDEANNAAGVNINWSKAERAEMETLAAEMDRQITRYPVIHCWRTGYHGGSQLEFWCQYCKTHHVHGRHGGQLHVDSVNRWDAEDNWTPRLDAVMPLRVWRRYLQRFASCTYNPNYPGGRGTCTCPVGSGNGHRVAHCWNQDSGYYRHGYYLHEVEPNDPRALHKPQRVRKPRLGLSTS